MGASSQAPCPYNKNDAITQPQFPIFKCTIAKLATIIILLGIGVYTYDVTNVIKKIQAEELRMVELRGNIIYLDEVLTMSSRIAAQTGDLSWENRYNTYVTSLDKDIKEATSLAQKMVDKNIAATNKTDQANQKLVLMERKAFALIKADRLNEAQKILFSDGYKRQKKIYAQGMAEFYTSITKALKHRIQSEIHKANYVFVAITIAIITLLIASKLTLTSILRWKQELETLQSTSKPSK